MLSLNLSEVDISYLQMVCGQSWQESPTLDFKRELPAGTDKDKHELLKDVCASANSDGGDLIFGIEELDGAASNLRPITTEGADAAKRRIAQTLDSGLEPRVLGVQVAHIEIGGGYILVLRVPSSYLGPHCIRVNNARRFVMRNGTSTTDLTFNQLRSAFDRTASLGDRARDFVRERNIALQQRATPKPLKPGPICALHFVPLSGLATKQAPNLQELHGESYTRLFAPGWSGGNRVFNLDGLVVYPGGPPDEGHYGYAQVFRNGAMEAASLGGGSYQQPSSMPEKLVIWSLEMTKYFRERTETFLSLAKDLGFSGPAVFSFSMLHVGGYEMGVDPNFRNQPTADRAHLVAPELWTDNLESASVDSIVRPLLDTLWQGFGMKRCIDFDEKTGEYTPRRN